jgi:hypothetical protein
VVKIRGRNQISITSQKQRLKKWEGLLRYT